MRRFQFISAIAIIITIILMPIILWHISPSTTLNISIIDKTVPSSDFREHKGLVWILNNKKIINAKTNKPFFYNKDYYGFHPQKNNVFTTSNYSNSGEKVDLIYITDTYGVYDSDFGKLNERGERSQLIYGGINSNEIEAIRNPTYMGSTLIAEFNTFATPTKLDQRKELYDLLGLKWSGWIGRYFNNLEKGVEVPDWAIENYEKNYNTQWAFKKGGLIFVNENDSIIIIEDKDLLLKGVDFELTKKGSDFFNKNLKVKYDYWFDIVETSLISNTLANYNIKLSDSALRVLEENGIPTEFPAVIRQENSQYVSYYFAGDYSDYPDTPNFYKLKNWPKIMEKAPLPRTDAFFWKAYVPMMNKILHETKINAKASTQVNQNIASIENIHMVSKTNDTMLQVYSNKKWEDLFIKGVNLGMALPGKWFTDFPKYEDVYMNWFKDISEMNANTIRVYTLMDPSFYRALLKYNDNNPENPLWLLQEFWPEEHPKDNDYLRDEYIDDFFKEIEYGIDAIHGNASISERKGRAYGRYNADVSKYVIGLLVGRELEPEEVFSTNSKSSKNNFRGEYIQVKNSSPTEVWIAMSCDYLIKYQTEKYSWQHPVAIVSWPTLDVINHDSEWNLYGLPEYNDRESIDIRNFSVTENFKAGLFGAYHIYPNYPDFMNNTLEYAKYYDDDGSFRYGGYLKQFIEVHTGYPALVAEFGLANGMGNAHYNPDGYNHGAMTEKQQGEGIVRMMKSIKNENYAGGVIFEWMDEWAKKTWTTEPFIIPYEHNVFWHNAMDPEQNYGILAIESIKPETSQLSMAGKNIIKTAQFSADATFVYIDIETTSKLDLSDSKLLIGLDTYNIDKGTLLYSPELNIKAPTGMEFLVEFSNENASLLTIPDYNISKYKFASSKNPNTEFERIMPIINSKRITKDGRIIPEIRNDNSHLNKGNFDESFYHWNQNNNTIHLRLPWTLLNITDPTTHSVLDDNRAFSGYPARDTFKTTITDGIRFTFILLNQNNVVDTLPNDLAQIPPAFLWESWGEPDYRIRLKKSFYIIQEYFKND